MAKRRIILSPFIVHTLEVLDDRVLKRISNPSAPHFRDSFYTWLFQAGVDEFEVATKTDFPQAEYLKSRVVSHIGPEWADAFLVVKEVTDQHLGKTSYSAAPSERVRIEAFLIDLLYALARRTSFIQVIPRDSDLVPLHLPSQLDLPLHRLVQSFESVQPEVAATAVAITASNAARFQEIMSSQVFEEYVAGHRQLENTSEKPREVEKAIREAARRLQRRNARLLKLQKVPVSILPATTRLIDAVFGALPGKLAELASNLLGAWLSQNQRIVVYEFSEPERQIIHSRVTDYARRLLKSDDGEIPPRL